MEAVVNYIQVGQRMSALVVKESVEELAKQDQNQQSFLLLHPTSENYPIMLNKTSIVSIQTKAQAEMQRKAAEKQNVANLNMEGLVDDNRKNLGIK